MRRFCMVAAALLGTACDIGYDFKGGTPEPQVVVNALISPQDGFSIDICRSGVYNDEYPQFKAIGGAVVRLFEDGREVLSFTTIDPSDEDILYAAPSPPESYPGKAGCRYRVEVDIPDYGRVAAETCIPATPEAELNFSKNAGRYRHFELSKLETGAGTSAVWIRGFRKNSYGGGEYGGSEHTEKHYEYYTSSPFVDSVNGVNDAYEAGDKGAAVDYEQFLRIPADNFEKAVPLCFSVYGNNVYAGENYEHTFCVFAASDEYDRYFRSLYKYSINSGSLAEENPFIEQISVYTNVENGLGIFAGYNCLTFTGL